METISALLAICAGNSPVSGEFSAQKPVARRFDVFFDLRLDGRLRKHSWGWWFETPSCPLWRQSNDLIGSHYKIFRAERLRYDLHTIFVTNESAMIDYTLWWNWYYNCLWNSFLIFSPRLSVNTLRPRQMDAICQTTFSSAFYWMKTFELLIKFHRSLFLRVELTTFQHWFR